MTTARKIKKTWKWKKYPESKKAARPKRLVSDSLVPDDKIDVFEDMAAGIISKRFVDLAIFYGEAMHRQGAELRERYRQELIQRFEELLVLRDEFKKKETLPKFDENVTTTLA